MAKELKDMSVADLEKKMAELREKLRKDRFDSAGAQLTNSAAYKAAKKDIARIESLLATHKLAASNE